MAALEIMVPIIMYIMYQKRLSYRHAESGGVSPLNWPSIVLALLAVGVGLAEPTSLYWQSRQTGIRMARKPEEAGRHRAKVHTGRREGHLFVTVYWHILP